MARLAAGMHYGRGGTAPAGDMLSAERDCWRAAPQCVLAGVDEAGRGPLAGPVCAAAVTLPPIAAQRAYAGALAALTDSKRLSPAHREIFFELLTHDAEISFGVGWCSVAEIDELNILAATHLAMRRALEALPLPAQHALVDGLPVRGLPCPSTAIIGGDATSFLIAGASIIAKVQRDRYMLALDERFPLYGFAAHKGYGVRSHMEALYRYGPCPEHRRSFRPIQDALRFHAGS